MKKFIVLTGLALIATSPALARSQQQHHHQSGGAK